MERSPYDDLPETVLAALADRTLLSLPGTASLLNLDRGTLRRMLDRGDITARQKGVGSTKIRFVFTIADVARYLRSTHTIEQDRHDLLAHLRATLGRRPPGRGTMNVTLARRRSRRAKAKLSI
jgi:hypothetical protein